LAYRLLYVAALGAVLVTSVANSADIKEMSCRATRSGAEHVAKIAISRARMVSFFYGSMKKNGNSCELFSARGEKGASWVDEKDGKTLVSVFAGEEEVGKVLIQSVDSKL
jgi:hypothetical protein